MSEHTGGMVALIPRADDAEKLRVTGGDKVDQLHLTLAYLGDDVTGWTADARNHLTAAALNAAQAAGSPVAARVTAHAVFNPDGHDDHEPCAVYLIGDNGMLAPLHEMMRAVTPQEQFDPYVPHVTAGFGIPFSRLKYTGPVVFDRLRVAFADDTYDFPLGEVGEKSIASDFLVETTVDEIDFDDLVEHKVMSGDPRAAKLREYWAHGAGRAKWNKWRELHRHLKKYVKNPNILDGLTSNIYRLAKGHNPPRGKKGMVELSEVEIKAALALADLDADIDPDALGWLDEDEDDDAEFDENDPDQVYERALIDDVDWEVDSDGSLMRADAEDEFEPEDEEEIPDSSPPAQTVSLWDLAESD